MQRSAGESRGRVSRFRVTRDGGRMRALDLFWVRSGESAEGVTSALPKLDRDFSRLLGMELSPGELV